MNGPPVFSAGVWKTPSPEPGATTPPPDKTVPESPGPEYDEGHRLDETIPPLINGLEMPVIGATGYTTVELPLWSTHPNKPYEPNPTPSPSPSEPEPSAEPDPPAEPTPLPSQFVDPIWPSEEPAPTAEPEPTAEPTQGPEQTGAVARTAASAAGPSELVAMWGPGKAFWILAEDGDWWYVVRGGDMGWIEHRYCMINLPDVIPSIIYNDTNAFSSIFVSCGKNIPGITGQSLYSSQCYNRRLDRQEFVMPILYSAARNICAAQHKALAEGNCLVVYQTFRPYQAQIDVANAVASMARSDPEVRAGISTSPWSIDWFIATGVSNHQRGYALDVSMVKVYATELKYVGDCPYLRVTDYEDYRMPTAMHELSMAARSTVSPSSSQLSETMNDPAIALRRYVISSGLSPLASEWWHFNDLAAMRATENKPSDGRYYTSECLSQPPEWVPDMLGG